MKKKVLLLLLALFTFVSADAEVDLATNLLYSVSGDAITITGYNGTVPENYSLVIPSQIEGKNVTTIAGSAFAAQSHSSCINITSIELPQTLTSIGELAFQGVNCSTITFPSGITSLPHGVIANNSHLKEICFEGNITSLGSWCFSEDNNVERLVFYANTTPPTVGGGSFYRFNSSLCKVYVPRGSSSNWGSTWSGFEVIEGTLQKDTEGYYLLKTKQDWKEFAAIVLEEPAANARMIADIDLGDDQTTIGSPRNGGTVWYQGTFDGDGHTLTIAYNNTNGEIFTTPFTLIQGATIKNLHIDGTVNTVYAYGGSVASIGRGSNTLKNIWNSVTSVCTMGGWDQMGAFFGVLESGSSMDVSDCLFTGSMSHPGGFSGYFSGGYGPGPNVSNSLVLGEFTGSYGFNGSFTNCYLKHASTTGVTIPTDEQLADGTIATALGDAWVQDPVLGIPLPKIFANTGEEVAVTDLSATETANTYIVSAAGKYKFNATVKGNGGLDPLTGTIATPIDPASIAGVKVLWELGDTYGRAIKYEDSAYDISYSDGYVYFSTPNSFTTGVACVAIYDSSDNILWSWDIWSTPEPGTATYNGNTFMDRNLCAVDLNNNRGFLYQWGRKDAFSAATGGYASFTFVPALSTAFNTVTGIQSIDYCIKHPTTHVNNGDSNSWMSREEYNTLPWRDDVKTIYDPCPAGWRVPTAAEQNGYSGLPGTGFSNAINEFGNPGSGYYRSSTISSYPKAYAFRQSGQQNNWGTNPAMAIRPVKEGIYFIYTVPASGLGTFSAPDNIIIPAGLTAYYCTTLKTYEDGKLGVRVSKLNGIIPANTGVLLEGSPGLSYPLTATTVEATAPAGNSLVAVVESKHIAATDGDYTNFMMKGGKFIKIQQDSEDVKMPANRAYLPLLTAAISGSNAKEIMLYWDDEEATGVERMRNVENEIMRNGNIYNLNGQKLSAPQKGINIINGRKVIVK